METELARTVGFPSVTFDAPELPQPVRIASLQTLDELAMRVPSIRQAQAFLAAELHAHRARWDEADRRLGYSAALQQEVAAYTDEARFAERLLSVDAISIAGVAAKIDILIETEAPSETCDEFPWPALRKIRSDLIRIMHQTLDHTV
ncbi:hypothetical protein GCM10007874_00090 [Labrys miyagiensis]|uniref:Uncharacterized protein n=1 Tax=Labrys miyagiensis TaxID=346912 RepID=A0ABQ6CEA4_9HYPH|nr:hypothetical protein GCM10007874_00090 [Labrys miyagiensis]